MSRRDPGAATGTPIREPQRCVCGHLAPLHRPTGRRACTGSACGCGGLEVGAGTTPAPAGGAS